MSSTTTTSDSTLIVPSLRPLYPIGIPSKFSPEGVVQRFPGNTTLCHIPANSRLFRGLRAVYASLESHPTLSKKIHLLPQASWHMTTLDGVREQESVGKEKQPLADCTVEFARRLRQLGLELEKEGLAPPYRMRVRGFDKCVLGVGLEIEGATVQEERRMRQLRDKLADTLGFRAPNHDTYGFHITIAYLMRHIDGEDRQELNRVLSQHLPAVQQEFDLGAVEFCTFENMYAFPRQFYLGEKE
ncbi:uncharacterized protein LY89DRAFT_736956 [Mollisia scopiformis]|uniref:DUF1868 domain-containing protein n=1 Tax=Mollisia scopiformis TaxID=149040 RepID=A0A194X190_MOLSC|nr:uncharacterized protein LY89DRAFT_736956 [Mollisia scopiformis]KUJ13953.1 hypothetical protein LY89DRAFT_736956 [Mollisia scopiformis]